MFNKPFSFTGRIRRMEFGLSLLIYYVVLLLIGMIASSVSESSGQSLLIIILYIPMVWFMIAQAAKRCYDLGNSGWWQLIPFYILWLIFQDGYRGRNEYGTDPKYPDQIDVLESETLDGHLKDQ